MPGKPTTQLLVIKTFKSLHMPSKKKGEEQLFPIDCPEVNFKKRWLGKAAWRHRLQALFGFAVPDVASQLFETAPLQKLKHVCMPLFKQACLACTAATSTHCCDARNLALRRLHAKHTFDFKNGKQFWLWFFFFCNFCTKFRSKVCPIQKSNSYWPERVIMLAVLRCGVHLFMNNRACYGKVISKLSVLSKWNVPVSYSYNFTFTHTIFLTRLQALFNNIFNLNIAWLPFEGISCCLAACAVLTRLLQQSAAKEGIRNESIFEQTLCSLFGLSGAPNVIWE